MKTIKSQNNHHFFARKIKDHFEFSYLKNGKKPRVNNKTCNYSLVLFRVILSEIFFEKTILKFANTNMTYNKVKRRYVNLS